MREGRIKRPFLVNVFGAYMCDEWKNSRDSFAEQYSANYYECGGKKMALLDYVRKDGEKK